MRGNLTDEERERVLALFPAEPPERRRIQRAMDKYIFYRPDGKNRRVYHCAVCGEFEAYRHGWGEESFLATHNKEMICPRCGFRGTLISLRKRQGGIRDEEKFVLLREADGWLLAEAGYGVRKYSVGNMSGDLEWHREAIYAFAPGKRQKWKTVYNWENGHTKELAPAAEVTEPFGRKGSWFGGYSDDGSYLMMGIEAVARSGMRYCELETALRMWAAPYTEDDGSSAYLGRGGITWLSESTGKPALEMLIKIGERDICRSVYSGRKYSALNWKSKTVWGVLRIGKAEYKRCKAAGMMAEEIMEVKTEGIDLPKACRCREVVGKNWKDFYRMYGAHRAAGKLLRYLEGIALDERMRSREERYRLWKDTMMMERQLGNDTSHENVLMPEDLEERHDECVELLNRQREERKRLQRMEEEERRREVREQYTKRREKLKRLYEYTDGVLEIIVPESGEEIEREGQLLGHCVAGYADRHCSGIKCILFLRWADDRETPYMTIELDEKKKEIVQIHGWKNDTREVSAKPREIHGEFLEAWLEWIRNGSKKKKEGKAA